MRDGGQTSRLGDLCRIEHGFAFKGEFMREEDEGPVVVNIGNFRYEGGFRFDSTRIQRYSGEFPDRYKLSPGEVLLVMTCQTPGGEILGIPARVPDDSRTYLHNQRLGRLVITDATRLDVDFAYYLFLSATFNRHLVRTATGAKILHTAPGRIEDFRFAFPSMEEQRRVGGTLRGIDDLIENNLRRIRVLEELGARRWARLEREATFAELKVEDVIECGGGTTPPRATEKFWSDPEADVDWYTPSDLTRSGFMFATTSAEKLSASTIDECRLRVFPARSVMMTSRATIGVISINTRPACTNQGFIVCLPNERLPLYVLYHWMRSNVDRFQQHATGSTFKELTRGAFRRMSIRVPDQDVARAFEQDVAPLYDLALNLQQRLAVLRNLRGLLLPKLLSGVIDVARLPLSTA